MIWKIYNVFLSGKYDIYERNIFEVKEMWIIRKNELKWM